jgi:hypothetical protein
VNRYPKYTTTVIGAYSVPDWYEPLDRLMSVGQLSMTAMSDAQYRASEAAIHDQERAGIDVITGGEMHRRTHNRHSPPNAMLNYFWQKNSGVPGCDAAEADHAARPERLSSGGDLPGADPGQYRSWPGGRIQGGVGADRQAGQDHHDRAAYAGQSRL